MRVVSSIFDEETEYDHSGMQIVHVHNHNYDHTYIADVNDSSENEEHESVQLRLAEHNLTDFSPFTSPTSALLYIMLHSPRPMVRTYV